MSEQVFLGVVTVPERDDYFLQVLEGVRRNFGPRYLQGAWVNLAVEVDVEHRGVAWAKNRLLTVALESGADWFFIMEDDVIVQSYEAITGYIAAAEASGWDHLAFHAHGPANNPGPAETHGPVTFWRNYVGAFCLYSRRSIETCGFFDEAFVNSWDHVEHTLRLSLAGFHPLPPEPFELRAADATGSEMWLKEIEGSIQNTSIPHTEEWIANRLRGRQHWKATYPESYRLVFSR